MSDDTTDKPYEVGFGKPPQSTQFRQGQSGIDGDHAHEGHVRKVVSFRQHLRADQQIDFAFAEIKQGLFKLVAARFRVTIDPAQAQIGKPSAQKFLDLFGSFADVVDVLAAAYRTLRGRSLMMIAVVTDQSLVAAMIRERDIAVWTLDRFAARATENETRIAATIQQDNRLFTTQMRFFNCP